MLTVHAAAASVTEVDRGTPKVSVIGEWGTGRGDINDLAHNYRIIIPFLQAGPYE